MNITPHFYKINIVIKDKSVNPNRIWNNIIGTPVLLEEGKEGYIFYKDEYTSTFNEEHYCLIHTSKIKRIIQGYGVNDDVTPNFISVSAENADYTFRLIE